MQPALTKHLIELCGVLSLFFVLPVHEQRGTAGAITITSTPNYVPLIAPDSLATISGTGLGSAVVAEKGKPKTLGSAQ